MEENGQNRSGPTADQRPDDPVETRLHVVESLKYAFIREYRNRFRISTMCRVLKASKGGFYALGVYQPLRKAQTSQARKSWHLALKVAGNSCDVGQLVMP